MGRTLGTIRKKTVNWQRNNNIIILLFGTDIIEHYTVDARGYISTNKRAWVGHKATVILGHHEPFEGYMYGMENVRQLAVYRGDEAFLCEVISGGFVSSIGKEYAEKEATVIIHVSNV